MKSRASLFFFLLATTFGAAQTYTVTDLGTLPGGNASGAKAINATAQVTGYSFESSTVSDVFRYSNGSMTNLGTLGGNTAIGNGLPRIRDQRRHAYRYRRPGWRQCRRLRH